MKSLTVYYHRQATLRRAAGLGVLAATGLIVLGAVPAFAWSSSVVGTTPSATIVAAGTPVTDAQFAPKADVPEGVVVYRRGRKGG